ncbi:MAG: xanthine dehydrogenase family protein subunit M [Alphaproteobacteria bacterium]|nr:xanthine dehydrogenase family protein subunit M [Alphaproteobacteria bacterium]
MQFHSPGTVDEAVSMLASAEGTSRVLAGGTDLLVQLRSGMVEPDVIVDLKRIEELRTITEEGGGFRIGAAVSCTELGEHGKLAQAWPGVVEAARLIGSEQIQSRSSLGGNICNASPAADTVPALIAARAVCSLAGPDGRRDVPVEDIATGPGKTCLSRGEFVVSLLLPKRPARAADAYLRFIPRTEMDIAVVGAGISLVLDRSGKVEEAHAGLGAVAPKALLVPEIAQALVGTTCNEDALEAAAAAARAACRPIDDKRGTVDYRTRVAGVLTKRAAQAAYERAQAK